MLEITLRFERRVRVVPSEEDDNVVVLGNSIQTPWSRALAKYIELRNER